MKAPAEPQKSIDTLQESTITHNQESKLSKPSSPVKSLLDESRVINVQDMSFDPLDNPPKNTTTHQKLDEIVNKNNRQDEQKRGLTTDPKNLMSIQVNDSKLSQPEKHVIRNKRNGMDAGMTSREFNTIDRLNTIIC